MKIAVLSDVHGNLPALEEVVRHARTQSVDVFWNLGDAVGYGPFPDECVRLLKDICQYSLSGNYDRKVLSTKHIDRMRKKGKDPDKIFSFEWTRDQLSPEARVFLRECELSRSLSLEGCKILLTHGSIDSDEEGLSPQTPVFRIEELSQRVTADIVLCGHSHVVFDFSVKGVRFINPGSIGRSFDGDYRASYCILTLDGGELKVRSYRLPYDVERLSAEMNSKGLPERISRSLIKGRSLEEVDDIAEPGNWEAFVQKAIELGIKYKFEKEHALKVTALALKIFDELKSEHRLTDRERFFLQCGCLLHDVGIVEGYGKHHKISRDIIINAEELGLSLRERTIIGLLARYHRGSLPDKKHRYYEQLKTHQQRMIDILAGILRVADGLDRSHKSLIRDISVKSSPASILLSLEAIKDTAVEEQYALLKADLLQQVFNKQLTVRNQKSMR